MKRLTAKMLSVLLAFVMIVTLFPTGVKLIHHHIESALSTITLQVQGITL